MIAIDKEFKFRYGKNHMSCLSLWESLSVIPDLPDIGLTVPPRAMDPEYKVGDGKTWDSVCESYRNYYVRGKRRLHSWKFRKEPEWFGTYNI